MDLDLAREAGGLGQGVTVGVLAAVGVAGLRHGFDVDHIAAISDIVSGHALKERTRRNVDLWAACIAGAVPRDDYLRAITDQGLEIREVRRNDYRFVSARALEACSTYAVESISLLAVKRG